MSTVYHINRGINKPIEFHGLKAQYIGYLAAGLVALLVLFALLYITGLNMYLCLLLVLSGGAALFMTVIRLSHTYGQFGLMKKRAKVKVPFFVRISSRKHFSKLRNHANK